MLWLGHIADDPAHRVTPIRHLFDRYRIGARAPNARGIDFRSSCEIMDQGQTSSCVGHAIAGSIQARFKRRGTIIPNLSPVSVYDFARLVDAEPDDPLVDEGSRPSSAFRGITEWGIAKREDRPTDPVTINVKPKLLELESAAGFQFKGYYEFSGRHQERVQSFVATLDAGIPTDVALIADDALMSYQGGIYRRGGEIRGGHYVYLAGYEILPDGYVGFHVVSSWGKGWGDNGTALVHELEIDSWTDCYAIDVVRA